jgi:hypothetical protein
VQTYEFIGGNTRRTIMLHVLSYQYSNKIRYGVRQNAARHMELYMPLHYFCKIICSWKRFSTSNTLFLFRKKLKIYKHQFSMASFFCEIGNHHSYVLLPLSHEKCHFRVWNLSQEMCRSSPLKALLRARGPTHDSKSSMGSQVSIEDCMIILSVPRFWWFCLEKHILWDGESTLVLYNIHCHVLIFIFEREFTILMSFTIVYQSLCWEEHGKV